MWLLLRFRSLDPDQRSGIEAHAALCTILAEQCIPAVDDSLVQKASINNLQSRHSLFNLHMPAVNY